MGRHIAAAGSAYPTITPLKTKDVGQYHGTNKPEGFAGDKDYFLLPANASGNLEYYNNSDTVLWVKSKASFQGTATHWIGAWLNDDKSLLYVLTSNSAGPDFQLHTIDSAGTINSIGDADTPTTPPTTACNYCATIGSTGSSMIAPDSDGDILVYQVGDPANNRIAKIDISTGQFLSGFGEAPGHTAFYAGYKSADGIYFSLTAYLDGTSSLSLSYANQTKQLKLPISLGFPYAGNYARLQRWGGVVALVDYSSLINYGPYAWSLDEMDAAILELAKIAGIQL